MSTERPPALCFAPQPTLGEVAFVMYNAAHVDPDKRGKTFDGRDVPSWDNVGPEVRTRWEVSARVLYGLGSVGEQRPDMAEGIERTLSNPAFTDTIAEVLADDAAYQAPIARYSPVGYGG